MSDIGGYTQTMTLWLTRLEDIGFAKTRRAIAAFMLTVFVFLYFALAMNAPEGWGRAFLALSLCYLVAFGGLVAEWFWGRWFATGIGWSGLMVGVFSLVMFGWSIPLAAYTGFHGLVVACLLGKKMAAIYDLQEAWRARFQMDEFGVARLRKTVTRSAASLPGLILWALGPKNPDQSMVHAAISATVAIAGISGLLGVLKGRTWGVLALAGTAAALCLHAPLHAGTTEFLGVVPLLSQVASDSQAFAGLPGLLVVFALSSSVAGVGLALAVAPFARPLVSAWRMTARR